ncbi:hypothetical protein ACLOJK_007992 [Asimina triloba]
MERRNGPRDELPPIGRQKSLPRNFRFSCRLEFPGDRRQSADVSGRSEGEDVSNAAFVQSVEIASSVHFMERERERAPKTEARSQGGRCSVPSALFRLHV